MISNKAQRQVGCYLAGMVLIHAILFYKEWPKVRQGFPDFSIFYTAALILEQGRGRDLYNDPLQESVQRSFAPAVEERGSILPFNHPPFEVLLFWPFARVSFLTGYLLYLLINGILLVAAVRILRDCLPALGKWPMWLWLLAAFGFPPVAIALLQGQDSIWVLLCYCAAFAAFRRNSELRAGVWLAMGLCKFHLVLPFMVGPFLQRRWRLIGGFSLTSIGLLLASVFTVGWKGVPQYPRYAWWADHVQKFRWNFLHGNTPNLRGMVLSLLPSRLWPAGEAFVLVASVGVMIFAIYFWRRGDTSSDGLPLAFAGTMVATVLVSYHTWVQDLSLLFLPLAVLFDFQLRRRDLPPALVRTIQVLCAILFCTPVYLFLILRYERLAQISWIILSVLAVIGGCIKMIRRQPAVPQSVVPV